MNTTYGSKGEGIKGHSCFNGYAGLGVHGRGSAGQLRRQQACRARAARRVRRNADDPDPPADDARLPELDEGDRLPDRQAERVEGPLAQAEEVQHRHVRRRRARPRSGSCSWSRTTCRRSGSTPTIKTFPFAVRIAKEGHRGEPYDLDLQAWGADYPDPVDFIDILLDGRNIQAENNNDNSYFNHPTFNNRMQCRRSHLEPLEALRRVGSDRPRRDEEAGSSGAALLPHGP